jgi:3-mercaptopyruvate sulfurtransferase SseA
LPRGRIEHSVNVPWSAVTDSATGRVRADHELRELFAKAGVDA